MNNRQGYTLLEITLTLGLLAIIAGISTISYRGIVLSVAKDDLKLQGKLFIDAVQNCVKAKGGWKRKNSQDNFIYPCKAENPADLKAKLGWTCPAEATCRLKDRTDDQAKTQSKHDYYCLSIEKEVSGKKLQTLVRISKRKPSEYKISCGEVSSFLPLVTITCKGFERFKWENITPGRIERARIEDIFTNPKCG